MSKGKTKTEKVNANNLRTPGFADFEATHEFTAESKKADFTRAAIRAGLSTKEIVEIGESIYGVENNTNERSVNWYRSSDPELNPGKERYKATGARSLAVKATVLEKFRELDETEQGQFLAELINKIGAETIISGIKVETLKEIAPAEWFPEKPIKVKKEMTKTEQLKAKQARLEAQQAKLKAELEAATAEETADTIETAETLVD